MLTTALRVLVIERRKRTEVAHVQLRSDERESSRVRAKQVSSCVALVGSEEEVPRAIDYIVASVRPLSPKAMNVVRYCCSTGTGRSAAKRGFLRPLGRRLSGGNLLLAGHFFLPCCIQ